MKILLPVGVLVAALGFACVAWSQMIPVSGIDLSGTILVTNNFQPIQGTTNNRQGCTIIPLGANNMRIYFAKAPATCANATSNNSFPLTPSQPGYCSVSSSLVLKDQVCITGTSGDAFYANFQ